jgi:hypothetical protein
MFQTTNQKKNESDEAMAQRVPGLNLWIIPRAREKNPFLSLSDVDWVELSEVL